MRDACSFIRGIASSRLVGAGCVLVAALAAAPRVGAESRPISAADIARTRTVTSTVISPDGSRVAFVLSVPREPWVEADDDADKVEDGPAWAELHVVDQEGKARPYVSGQVNVGSVKWTPDGSGISFLTKRGKDKHRNLYVIPVDGGEARRVVHHKTAISSYDWSPDGSSVAFLAREKEAKERKKQKDKGFTQEVYEEDWRPVRAWVAGVGDAPSKPRKLDLPGSAVALDWSPAGGTLAVSLAPTALIDDRYMKQQIHVVDVASGEVTARIDHESKLGRFLWSPDGKHLAVIAGVDVNDPQQGHLMVAPASGGALRDLTPDYAGHVASIAWQDNDTIMYLGGEGVWSALGDIGRDGTGRKDILSGGTHVLSGLSLSDDGRSAAFVGQSAVLPAEVMVMSHGDGVPRRLTNNNPWLDDGIRLAKQEVVTHKARDGLELQGLLIRPLDEKPGQRYPLVMIVHGGPESHNSNGWSTSYSRPGQLLAARGFAVFYPNYRGSTGRGVEFSKLGQADYAGKEFDDLVDAIDHLVGIGLVDKDRVGVTGGSYGGYASAWCATKLTKHFAASVMFVGISDLVSKFGTTDIPNEMFQVHARRQPWDHWDWFRERSPIQYVEQARTPILIMHGKDDPRVHPSQSMELYRYLKTLGKTPVRLVFYPGEGHGNRKASARLDYSLRLVRWMEHYLKGPGGEPPPYAIEYDWMNASDDSSDDEGYGDDD